jgi:hypothetical protein
VLSLLAGARRQPSVAAVSADSAYAARSKNAAAGAPLQAGSLEKFEIANTNPALRLTSGLLALATFLACLALPVWIFFERQSGVELDPNYKHWLLALSLLHLATAAIWVTLREKESQQQSR